MISPKFFIGAAKTAMLREQASHIKVGEYFYPYHSSIAGVIERNAGEHRARNARRPAPKIVVQEPALGRPRRIVAYTTVFIDDLADLEEEVNDLIEDGWQCFGGVVILPPLNGGTEDFYLQAMVKYEE